MNESQSIAQEGAKEINKEEEMNSNNLKNFNNRGYDLIERIYDEGQADKFNNLIKNPTKIKAVKGFMADDDIENMLNLPPDKTKGGFQDLQNGGVSGNMNHVSGNVQDLLSITGFKIIDKLPPVSGDSKNKTNDMIDRFRLSYNDFDNTSGKNTAMGMTKSKWNNTGNFEQKLSRPTTTIINLGKKYNVNKEENDKKEKQDEIKIEEKKVIEENPLEELNKEIDESDQDEYMNLIHKFLRDAFKGRDHKMDFVYFLPSNTENYYKLTPKTFKEISDKKTYYTLSSKGLTVYIDKNQREVIKLAEWMN